MFICQNDSFKKELETRVVSCDEFDGTVAMYKRIIELKGWEVVLEDTILFPEGGGQPSDFGTIDGIEVVYVIKRGTRAIHYVKSYIEVGKTVLVLLDWERRFDHMQQHSAQHLITGLAIQMYGFETTSWDLLTKSTTITLKCGKLSQDKLTELENASNEKIRDQIPFIVKNFHQNELDPSLRGRLPQDHQGQVRVVDISGIDANMCCGTHVANTSQLQAVKILGGELKKSGFNLFFIAGQRVIDRLTSLLDHELQLNRILKCGQSEHVDQINKMDQLCRQNKKIMSSCLKELAGRLAEDVDNNGTAFLDHHRTEGDEMYMSCILTGIKKDVVMFISVGSDEISFVIKAPKRVLESFGEWLGELGKGSLLPNERFRGKARYKMRKNLVNKLRTLVDSN